MTPVLARDGTETPPESHSGSGGTFTTQSSNSSTPSLTTSELLKRKLEDLKKNLEAKKDALDSREAKHDENQASREAFLREKLAGANLKKCQERQEQITKRATALADRSTKQADNFARIMTMLEAAQAKNPTDTTRYAALIVQVKAKKLVLDAAIVEARAALATFSCTTEAPREKVTAFKTKAQAVRIALKAYRSAIIDLAHAMREARHLKAPSASVSATPLSTGGEREQ